MDRGKARPWAPAPLVNAGPPIALCVRCHRVGRLSLESRRLLARLLVQWTRRSGLVACKRMQVERMQVERALAVLRLFRLLGRPP